MDNKDNSTNGCETPKEITFCCQRLNDVWGNSLFSIIGGLSILKQTNLTKEQQKIIQLIEAGAEKMKTCIDCLRRENRVSCLEICPANSHVKYKPKK